MTDIAGAIEALRGGEESARRKAVDALARSGRPEAIAPLLSAVSDEAARTKLPGGCEALWCCRFGPTSSTSSADP